ncbi:C-GCAxxG-C-C family protein [Mogibacterium sp.]
MDNKEIGELFIKGQDCGQIVLEHFADRLGISHEEANKLTSAFGGGIGIGETCGAVMGAMIVIGIKYGHLGQCDNLRKDEMTKKRAEFIQKWNNKHDACRCKDLLGYDIGSEDGLHKILEEGLLFSVCPVLVNDTIDILEDII